MSDLSNGSSPARSDEVEPFLGGSGPDPWAHRRAEPRPLALLWTLYLLGACLLTLGAAVRGGIAGPDVCRPATRLLLAIVGIGLAVVWPLIRLSQARPAGSPVVSVARDTFVVVVPVQLLIWPHLFHWLSAWPLGVVAGLSAWSVAWGVLIGGVLALALTRLSSRQGGGGAHLARAAWMAVFLALTLAGTPVALLVQSLCGMSGEADGPNPGSSSGGDLAFLASPVFGVFELARDWPERIGGAALTTEHWVGLGAVGAAGLVAWAFAAVSGERLAPDRSAA